MKKNSIFLLFFRLVFVFGVFLPLSFASFSFSNDARSLSIGRLKYNFGDWYSNPSSLGNLLSFFQKSSNAKISIQEKVVSLKDSTFLQVPIIYFTGHGKIQFSETEKENLRWFLKNGGFLFADDNYGMDKYIRKELNSLFTNTRLVELPWTHPIFQHPFSIKYGVPKIHKHYGGRAQAFALFFDGKMVAFYAYNTDLGDGWEDIEVHNHNQQKQDLALKMGANVLWYALNSGLVHRKWKK